MMLKTAKYDLKKYKAKQKQIQIYYVSNDHYRVENDPWESKCCFFGFYLLWENYAK